MPSLLNAAQPIVEKNGTMAQAFRDAMIKVQNQLPINGTGSPEGVINAPQYSLYLDNAGGAGAIQYRKMLPSISNDTAQGWVLV